MVKLELKLQNDKQRTHFAYINSNILWKFIALCTLVLVFLVVQDRIRFIRFSSFVSIFFRWFFTNCLLLVLLELFCHFYFSEWFYCLIRTVWRSVSVQFIYGQIHMSFSSSLCHSIATAAQYCMWLIVWHMVWFFIGGVGGGRFACCLEHWFLSKFVDTWMYAICKRC